jgi:murein DD-endopeptidase MepM/ murein hydrolase activator NlpD
MTAHWHRRVRRPRPASRAAALARGLRLLGLLLVATGCAVEGPPPIEGGRLPPADAGPSPGAPTAVGLVPPPIISGFAERTGAGGPRLWPHAGIDIRAAVGTPILAAADGIVARTGVRPLAGRLVVVAHADALATVYYHLSEVVVAAGQAVRRGSVLGRAGRTGNATTPHLHFGVCRREGGACGEGVDSGWDDPARHWVGGEICFHPARTYPEGRRLTYPVPCSAPPA